MQEIGKFDVKIDVISNILEKYIAFVINKNLVFIDRMGFVNSSLDTLAKNLSDDDLKYLSQEFSGKHLKSVKQKRMYPYEHINSFEKFSEVRLSDKNDFYSSLKDACVYNV